MINDPYYDLEVAQRRMSEVRSEVSGLKLQRQVGAQPGLLDGLLLRISRGALRRESIRDAHDNGATARSNADLQPGA